MHQWRAAAVDGIADPHATVQKRCNSASLLALDRRHDGRVLADGGILEDRPL